LDFPRGRHYIPADPGEANRFRVIPRKEVRFDASTTSRIDGVYQILQRLIAAPAKPKHTIGFLSDAVKR